MVRQRVDLVEVVRKVLAELPQEERPREVEWRLEPLPSVDGDAGLLKLAFFYLLSNAVKFTGARQPVVIEVGASGSLETPVIFIRDNGVGFDPDMPISSLESFSVSIGRRTLRGLASVWPPRNASFTGMAARFGLRQSSIVELLFS